MRHYLNLFETHQTEINDWLMENTTLKSSGYNKHTILGNKVNTGCGITLFKPIPYELFHFGSVHGNFDYSDLDIDTLKGCPHHIYGSFKAFGNNISSLEYSPKFVGGDLYISYNKRLTSFEHISKSIGNSVKCTSDKISPWEMRYLFFSDVGFNNDRSRPVILHDKYSEVGYLFEEYFNTSKEYRQNNILYYLEELKKLENNS